MDENKRLTAVKVIQKKLLGKELTYKEVFSVMDEIAHERLGDILTTYFVAAGFREGFSAEELYFLTKAMVDTGTKLHFEGIVADKHSTGGLPGTRTTMIVVPIIAALA
jgi:AMP phosphorylase